jgi:hypothetical protein
MRDVADAFADRVAARLNRPRTWEPSEPQQVADAVRHTLEFELSPTVPLVH